MRKALWLFLLLSGSLLYLCGLASAQTQSVANSVVLPTVEVIAGSRTYTPEVVPTTTGGKLVYQVPETTIQTADYMITFSATLNPDPFISYALGVVTFAPIPANFGFVFGVPIAAQPAGSVTAGSIVGGLTDATGNGVSIAPFGQPTVQVGTDIPAAVNFGVNVGPAAAFGPGPAGAIYVYGPAAANGVLPAPVNSMMATTMFTLSGSNDAAALTGFLSVNPAPETASVLPLLPGLALLGITRLRCGRRLRTR